jgi:hypothetical protein
MAFTRPAAPPHSNLPLRTRQPGPSPEEWQAVRPKFARLYLQEEPRLPLKDIIQLLAEQDGFVAKKYHFDLRIRQWDLHRNMKAVEKDRVIAATGAYRLLDQRLHNRVLRYDKIARYVRRTKRQLGPPPTAISGHTYQFKHTTDSTYGTATSPPKTSCVSEFPLTSNEIALYHVRNSCRMQLSTVRLEHESVKYWSVTRDLSRTWMDALLDGIATMNLGCRRRAVSDLDTGCDLFLRSLTVGESLCSIHALASDILALFCFSSWEICLEFRTEIIRFFHRVLSWKLERSHAILELLKCLMVELDSFGRPTWWKVAQRVSIDTLNQSAILRDARHAQVISFLLTINSRHEGCDNERAILGLNRLISKARESSMSACGVNEIKQRLVRVLCWAGRHLDARFLALEVLGIDDPLNSVTIEDDLDRCDADSGCIFQVLKSLHIITHDWNDEDERLLWAELAFRWALHNDITEFQVVLALDWLERCLIDQGRWSHLSEVRRDHAYFHSMLPDSTRLRDIPDVVTDR